MAGVFFYFGCPAAPNTTTTILMGVAKDYKTWIFLARSCLIFLKSDGEHAVFEFGLDAFFVDCDG